jgi:multiple sugar transport system substrate-binding protein
MGKKLNKIKILFLITLASLFFSGCSSSNTSQPQYKIALEVWGFDDGDVFSEPFQNYSKINPAIKSISYKKQTINVVNYKEELIDALAAGKGPDIFLIHNTWLPVFKDKIAEAPADIVGEQKAKNNFVDVVLSDFNDEGKIFALPLSVDSLALYYNKDLFNEAGITAPPEDWETFGEDARKMTKIDSTGQILQSGAALGTAYNINRATDVLAALMIQNGTEMTDAKKTKASFDLISSKTGTGTKIDKPGENALEFYTNFAKTTSANYSWDTRMHYSIDAFSEGKLGMMLNYSWQREAITNKSPKLNFDVAPLPQLPGKSSVSYANYWGFAVAKNKPASVDPQSASQAQSVPVSNDIRIKEAWKLITYLTTKPEISPGAPAGNVSSKNGDPGYDTAKKYMEKTAKPAARRDLIEIQKNDVKVGVFARQNLIAKSWYQADAQEIEIIMADMIEKVVGGQLAVTEAIRSGAAKVTQLMREK